MVYIRPGPTIFLKVFLHSHSFTNIKSELQWSCGCEWSFAFALPPFTSQPRPPWESNTRDTWYTRCQPWEMLLYNKYTTGMCGKHASNKRVDYLPRNKLVCESKHEPTRHHIYSAKGAFQHILSSSILHLSVRPPCIPSPALPVRWLLSIISSSCGNPFSGSAGPTKGLIES